MSLPIESGTVLEIYDKYHCLSGNTNGDKNDERYLGKTCNIGKLEVGQNFKFQSVKRFEGLSFVKNTNGNFKLVDI